MRLTPNSLFCLFIDKRLESVTSLYEVGSLLIWAGITGVTWHTLRHTFASRLLDRGVDIVTVKELLGHSTVLVTMRYLHPNLEAKVQAVAKLAANCDKSVTVRPKMQQLIPKVSQINR